MVYILHFFIHSVTINNRFKGFNTLATHSGELKDPKFGNVSTPIFETSTFVFPNYEKDAYLDHTRNEPYIYTRWGNPTLESLEKKYSALEGAQYGLSFSSGMSAIVTALSTLTSKGGKILAMKELYGQTTSLMTGLLRGWGIEVDFVPVSTLNSMDSIGRDYNIVYVESVSNPTLQVSDIPHIASLAENAGIPLLVDATFASPYNQRPLDMGASVSIHSGTKYIAGHSDVIIGMLATGRETFEKMQGTRKALGGTPDPLQAFLASRGLKTLGLRMEKHNRNGMEVAKFLSQHSKVRKVFYPGLETSESYEVARKVLKGYGGMVSFEVEGGLDSARKVMWSTSIAAPAPSLGGVESLITLPIDTSHSTIPRETRREMGIEDGLIRLSLGIEDHEDIIADLQQALDTI